MTGKIFFLEAGGILHSFEFFLKLLPAFIFLYFIFYGIRPFLGNVGVGVSQQIMRIADSWNFLLFYGAGDLG